MYHIFFSYYLHQSHFFIQSSSLNLIVNKFNFIYIYIYLFITCLQFNTIQKISPADDFVQAGLLAATSEIRTHQNISANNNLEPWLVDSVQFRNFRQPCNRQNSKSYALSTVITSTASVASGTSPLSDCPSKEMSSCFNPNSCFSPNGSCTRCPVEERLSDVGVRTCTEDDETSFSWGRLDMMFWYIGNVITPEQSITCWN